MSFMYNSDRTIDGENTLTTDILNCNLDFEVEGEKGSSDQYLHKNATTNQLEWSYSTSQITAGTHLSLSNGVLNCDLVEDDTMNSDNFKKNYITIDGEKIKLNLTFGSGITLVTTAPANNPTHTLRANIVADTTDEYKGIGIAAGSEVGLDIENLPVTTSLDLSGNYISRMIVQKYDTVALKWKNSQIAANVLSDAIYIPYVGGTGIDIDSTTISNTGILSVAGSGLIHATTSNGAVTVSTTFSIPSSSDIFIDNANELNELKTTYNFNGTYIKTTNFISQGQTYLQVDSKFRPGSNVTFTQDTTNDLYNIDVDLSALTFSQPLYTVTGLNGSIEPAIDGQGTCGTMFKKFREIHATNIGNIVVPVFSVNCTNLWVVNVQTDLIPFPHVGGYNLGSAGDKWETVYASTATISNLKGVATGTAPNINYTDITLYSSLVPAVNASKSLGDLHKRFNFVYAHELNTNSTSGFSFSGDLIPSADNTRDIGSSSAKLSTLYTNNITGFNLAGNISMLADDTLYLGANSHRFKTIYSYTDFTKTLIAETAAKVTNLVLHVSPSTTHTTYGTILCSIVKQYVNNTANTAGDDNDLFKEFNGTDEETQYSKPTSGNTAQQVTGFFRKRNIAGYEDIYGEPDTGGIRHIAFRYNTDVSSGSAFQAFDCNNSSGNYLFNLSSKQKSLVFYDGTENGATATSILKKIVEFDFGNKKTRFSNDSNQKIVEIDHASAASTISLFNTAGVKCQDFDATTSTISLYDTAGVKCLDFDATTGKTTLYQKTGVGTATRKIMDVNPATPTTHNGLQTSSPININTAALPHYTSIQFLQSGDLFGFANTNSVGAAIDYTLRYKA